MGENPEKTSVDAADFDSAVLTLKKFNKKIELLDREYALEDAYKAYQITSENSGDGNGAFSYRQQLFRELKNVFSYLVQDQSAEGAVLNYFHEIMKLENGRTVTREEAKTELARATKFWSANKGRTPNSVPMFIATVQADVDAAVLDGMVNAWKEALGAMEKIAPEKTVQKRKTGMEHTLKTTFENVSKTGTKAAVATNDNITPASPGLPQRRVPVNSVAAAIARAIEKYGHEIKGGNYPPVHGRDGDIENATRVLSHKNTPYILLSGPEGVGKSSVIKGLFQNVDGGKTSNVLKDAKGFNIDLEAMVLNSQNGPGELKAILEKVAEHNDKNDDKIMLYFRGYARSETSASMGLKEQLSVCRAVLAKAMESGINIPIICEVSDQELFSLEAKDAASLKSLHRVKVEPLPFEGALEELKHSVDDFASHHGVKVSDDMLEYIIKKTDRFMPNKFQPGKSMRVLEAALAQADTKGLKNLDSETIDGIIADLTNLPPAFVGSTMNDRIEHLADTIKSEVFGQDESVDKVASTIRLVNKGLHDPKKPLGVFYITGPTGVGKTELAKALARGLFENEDALIRVNMNDFGDKHTASRILGSPPGYVGYGEKTALEDVTQKPFSVVLLDEAEKAHPDVDKALMTLLDEGELTLLNGKKLNFKNTVIILTSNLGASEAEAATEKKPIGFGGAKTKEQATSEKANEAREQAAKLRLKPEFRNRVTLLNMKPLEREFVKKIALKKVSDVSKRLNDSPLYKDLKIELTEAALEQITDLGFDPRFGARPMIRAIQDYIQVPLNDWLDENAAEVDGKPVKLIVENVKGEFKARSEALTPPPAPKVKTSGAPRP